ncbi:MAG: uroporphyrinogen-III C-methyltransferase [Aestuariibaculum sp.]
MAIYPKITLVGAGPGDIDLITVKAVKAIASAQVVLYDALVNKGLLDYAPKDAELIFVGKRKGSYALQQHEINALIVEKAQSKGHVVRLKGGDPFIFGRGAEELEYAQKFGLQTEVVSGVSSAIAVPSHQGISLTKRGISESFWVVTGTTKQHKLSKDVRLAAQSTATVVILMGVHKLPEIIEVFLKENKHETPVAVIQNGTWDTEKIAIGTVKTIQTIVEEKQLSSPAIIVIGEVVKERIVLNSIYNEVIEA